MISSPPTDLFLSLTPERVLAAVEAGGLECNNLCYPLNSFENRVYEVELTDRNRVVAKFYRVGRWSEGADPGRAPLPPAARWEDIPVCTVRPFPDGSTLKQIDGIYYSLSDRRGGRAPDELDAAKALRLGMLVGRLHNIGADGTGSGRRPLDSRALHPATAGLAGRAPDCATGARGALLRGRRGDRGLTPIGCWRVSTPTASTPTSTSATCCCAMSSSTCSTSTT